MLRVQHYSFTNLPDTVFVPARGDDQAETAKPIETASVDDLAFAL